MALHRGIQSAIFYYLACTPCADARYRKKRKKQAERDRADKELLEAQMPNLYRHPSPSSTNPHWQAEIALGPAPNTRGKRKTTPTSDSQRGLKTSATQSSNGSNVASSVDVARLSTPDGRNDSRWHLKQQQRQDEELWGSAASDPPLRSFLDGPSVDHGLARPQKARMKDAQSYQSSRNPSINEFHPATVTKISSRDDIAWMLQPPPIAEVMSGKEEPAGSSTSVGGSSKRSVISTPVSRQAGNRLNAAKLPSGQSSVSGLSRESSVRTAGTARGQRHDGLARAHTTDERDFATTPSKREKRRPSPIQVLRDSEDSTSTVIRHSSLAPAPVARKVASRPQLSTIMSDNTMSSDYDRDFYTPVQTPKENRFPSSEDSFIERDKTARRSAILGNDKSLKLLQDLAPKAPMFNTKVFATSPALMEAKVRLPSQSGDEERKLSGAPELFDSWYTPDFELGEWVHEHTKREVKQRWSMDI